MKLIGLGETLSSSASALTEGRSARCGQRGTRGGRRNEAGRGDGGGGTGVEGLAGQHHDGAGDGAGRGGGGAGDEGFDLGVVAVADEPSAGEHDAEEDRGEDRHGGDDGALPAGGEVAD